MKIFPLPYSEKRFEVKLRKRIVHIMFGPSIYLPEYSILRDTCLRIAKVLIRYWPLGVEDIIVKRIGKPFGEEDAKYSNSVEDRDDTSLFSLIENLKNQPEVLSAIFEDRNIDGLRTEEKIMILLLTITTKDLSGYLGGDSDKYSRSRHLRTVRKCIEMTNHINKDHFPLLMSRIYNLLEYFLQWESCVEQREREKYCLKSWKLVRRVCPNFLKVDYSRLPCFHFQIIMHVITSRVRYIHSKLDSDMNTATSRVLETERTVKFSIEKYERCATKLFNFINYMRSNKDRILGKSSTKVTILNESYESMLRKMCTFNSKVMNFHKALHYNTLVIDTAIDGRNESNDGRRGEKTSVIGELYKRLMNSHLNMEQLEDFIQRALILIKLGELEQAWNFIQFVEKKRTGYSDNYMNIQLETTKLSYFEKQKNIEMAFEQLNTVCEIHCKKYVYNNRLTAGYILHRIEYLVRLERFKEANRDLQRLKKEYRAFDSCRIVKSYQFFISVCKTGLSDIKAARSMITKTLEPEERRLYLEVIRKNRTKSRITEKKKFLRKCSNSHCAKSETLKKRFQVCSGCWGVVYCSRKCQREHWKFHRDECGEKKMQK